MRESKFRAWSIKHNRYLKVTGVQYDDDKFAGVFVIYGTIAGIPNTIFLKPENVILEQSTGLKDKNGKRIFKGDIVRIMGYGTYEVFWRSWDSSFSLKAIDTDIEEHKILMLCEDWEGDYAIIGNIHENPELLEEE